MESLEVLYKRVYSDLKEYSEDLKQVHTELIAVRELCKDRCTNAETAMEGQLQENSQREAKLKAFIGIAKAHSSKLLDSKEIIAFDMGKLSRLMVQINNASLNDEFAAQLYTEATGQLSFVQQNVYRFQEQCQEEKGSIMQKAKEEEARLQREKSNITAKIAAYLHSQEFKEFIKALELDYRVFGSASDNLPGDTDASEFISIGRKFAELPIPDEFIEQAAIEAHGLYDMSTSSIGIPVCFNMLSGAGILVNYRNETENTLLLGMQKFLINVARYFGHFFEQVVFVDPVRFNNSSLGVLEPLAMGSNSFIDSVPLSMEDVRKKLSAIIAAVNAEERKKSMQMDANIHRRLLFFHSFPQGYDSTMISQIQQLFVNAAHYNLRIIVTHNCSAKSLISSDALSFMKTVATNIDSTDYGFEIQDNYGSVPFQWYSAPPALPEDISRRYIYEKPMVDTSNDYDKRLGLARVPVYRKGIRKLVDIPYGIDAKGNILTLDFENTNFATFICGAARSGKSTLLHTLITGIIKNNHPDDVEIWLIDFKMTEFSRYINHLPPHVRYIILDESPELVYDIINRLTEIMTKRQNIFKGKWQKLDEVPPEKYMPAIFVIIDEFSVMSQIIADSLASSKENYSIKLQTLLAKGAALGLHFVFASQGFTSGTRGLNDFSKKQIQQRIAMKTEYNEIKETLDLKSTSDDDRAMMEQLPVHHALVRVPVDDRGNHLLLSQVLFIPDYGKQERMIDSIYNQVTKAPRYDVNNTSVYIDKKPMIVDGNNYIAFEAKRPEIEEHLQKHRDILADGDESMLFLGEPRRMLPLYPIEIINGFCENMLLIAPVSEKMPATSVLMSIASSLSLQGKAIEVWTTKKNPIYRQMIMEANQPIQSLSKDLQAVCTSIRELKERIQSKQEGDRYIVLLGFETLIMDMSYQENLTSTASVSSSKSTGIGGTIIEKRADGEMDLNSLLDSLSGIGNVRSKESEPKAAKVELALEGEDGKGSSGAYDARNDLKYILAQGPPLGYHFIMVFNAAGEVNQSKLDTSLFKHKVLFRMPKADATGIIGSFGAGVISELEDHSFRYTNGLDAISFRPYLHPGLAWDGWQISGDGVTNLMEEEEEYLL